MQRWGGGRKIWQEILGVHFKNKNNKKYKMFSFLLSIHPSFHPISNSIALLHIIRRTFHDLPLQVLKHTASYVSFRFASL